jgi:hypothetical protein
LLAVHWEMQRLAEEFFHGHRVRELLEVVILTIRANGFRGPLRIVDVGSGVGSKLSRRSEANSRNSGVREMS